jgi:hypothetical protein
MDRSRWGAALVIALLGCALPTAGTASDLLRCTLPDGRVIYTDDKSQCPDAQPYRPSGSVHEVTSKPAPPPPPDAPAARGAESATEAQAAEAQRWRELKASKEEELRQVTRQHTDLRGWVSFCNDGHTVITRDEAGLQQRIPCSQLNARLEQLAHRADALRDYLENELPEECRRAGCLPGWIR